MLRLGSRLIGTPVMGLQTGSSLATIKAPVINPGNLKIIAYEIEGPLLNESPSFLRTADIREMSSIGMIIDSSDEFVGLDDVIAIKKLYELGFKLLGMSVIDEAKHKLGKVDDYSIDLISFFIEQISVKRGVMKSFGDTGLLIHRSQVVEINNRNIIVRQAKSKLVAIKKPNQMSYLNPFRPPNTQVDGGDS